MYKKVNSFIYYFFFIEANQIKLKTELHIQLILFKFELPNIGVYYLNMLRFSCLLTLLSKTLYFS